MVINPLQLMIKQHSWHLDEELIIESVKCVCLSSSIPGVSMVSSTRWEVFFFSNCDLKLKSKCIVLLLIFSVKDRNFAIYASWSRQWRQQTGHDAILTLMPWVGQVIPCFVNHQIRPNLPTKCYTLPYMGTVLSWVGLMIIWDSGTL